MIWVFEGEGVRPRRKEEELHGTGLDISLWQVERAVTTLLETIFTTPRLRIVYPSIYLSIYLPVYLPRGQVRAMEGVLRSGCQ